MINNHVKPYKPKERELIMKTTTSNQAVTVSSNAAMLLKDAVSNTEKNNNRWVKASDALFADGIRAGMLTGTDKVADIQTKVKASIVLGLPITDRKLINGDAKAMDDTTKALRKTAQQKIGAYLSRIQGYLINLSIESGEIEANEETEETEETEESTKTVAEKLAVMLESCLKLVQGDDEPDGYDPVIMAKALNQAAKAIK